MQDVGRAIHPSYVEGQIQGGAAQGIGWALNEEYIYDEKGRLDNPGFLDYRMPVASDLPMIEAIMVEVPNPRHPFGARGVGEVPIVPPMAAVANAIRDAIGMRMTRPADVAAQAAGGAGCECEVKRATSPASRERSVRDANWVRGPCGAPSAAALHATSPDQVQGWRFSANGSGETMPRVVFSGSAAGRFIGGRSEIEVTATTFRRLVKELDERFPGLGKQVEDGMAVAIDGVIYQDAYSAPLAEGSGIYLIPKIAGG